MAVQHGYGKIAGADALVFAYDTGDTRNSYKGEPTTNLNVDPLHSTTTDGETIVLSNWGGDTGYGEFKTNTSPVGGGMMFINHNTSNPEGSGGTYTDFPSTRYTLENGKTYTRSWYAKATKTQNISGHVCSCNRDSDNTYIVGDSITVTPDWQRFEHTFTYSGTTSTDWQFRHIIYSNNSVSIANVQLEEKSHATQFTTGTRSATQGLVDLTGNSEITLDSVSFDSNAQMVFDGTDDFTGNVYVGISDYSQPFTMECVFIVDPAATWDNGYRSNIFGIAGSYSGMYGLTKHGGDSVGLYVRDASGGAAADVGGLSKGVYYHLVGTWDGTNDIRIYLNGSLRNTTTSAKSGATDTTSIWLGGRRAFSGANGEWYHGEIPVAKYYNRALTAAEVQANFNHYKTRFNLE